MLPEGMDEHQGGDLKELEILSSDLVLELLRGAEEMFGQVLGEVGPYPEPKQVVHLLFFRRFTEWQYQYCRAIRTLYEADCFQGTIPLLRSLMEASVAQILLQRDTDFSTLLDLLNGERVKVAGALKQIGWPDSENDMYARLSKMTHPSTTNAFLGRTLDFASEPLKSLVAQKDLAAVAGVILWDGAPENEAARQTRWVFVALNAFDLAVSSLFTLFGAAAPEGGWWGQRNRLATFKAVAELYPSMQQDLLWFKLTWPHPKQSEMERNSDRLLNSG